MLYVFAMILAVIGYMRWSDKTKALFEIKEGDKYMEKDDGATEDYPGQIYYHVGNFLMLFFTAFRFSLGDNDFDAVGYL